MALSLRPLERPEAGPLPGLRRGAAMMEEAKREPTTVTFDACPFCGSKAVQWNRHIAMKGRCKLLGEGVHCLTCCEIEAAGWRWQGR